LLVICELLGLPPADQPKFTARREASMAEATGIAGAVFDGVMRLIEQQHRRRGAAAQTCVIRALGCASDALFRIFRASRAAVLGA
jgi:hypothetical protein